MSTGNRISANVIIDSNIETTLRRMSSVGVQMAVKRALSQTLRGQGSMIELLQGRTPVLYGTLRRSWASKIFSESLGRARGMIYVPDRWYSIAKGWGALMASSGKATVSAGKAAKWARAKNLRANPFKYAGRVNAKSKRNAGFFNRAIDDGVRTIFQPNIEKNLREQIKIMGARVRRTV